MDKYRAIGLMSGTSLDGLDVAACEFTFNESRWSFEILYSHTYSYSEEWNEKLINLPFADALTFSIVNVEYGHLLGRLTRNFMEKTGFLPEFIASHGHTIFHRPGQGITVQIGAGSAIAAEAGYPVICDFRTTDVALGGQGAPLVPAGDRLLFPEFYACLNLGGFANISMEFEGQRIAFDICPVNIVLNRLAKILGLEYDRDGKIARNANINGELLENLDQLDFYKLKGPKSLGREWLEEEFLPVLVHSGCPVEDKMRTVCEHIAVQTNLAVISRKTEKILVTGGGSHHQFLMERIRCLGIHNYVELSKQIADYKEALVFAFLGLLRWQQKSNILSSVTGSKCDHSGGAIYLPGKKR